ncbi:MAG: DUF5696 domain-containing protein [Oscillospiraceae bacterium]|nr:DUF5696 domain-containing protein [Oscillospiraceae bacterium]
MQKHKNINLKKRLLTLFLAIVMGIGCLSYVPSMVVFATAAAATTDTTDTSVFTISQDYTTKVYASAQDKLKDFGTMTSTTVKNVTTTTFDGQPVLTMNGYELYYQAETGEVAVKDTSTGQVLFSNPVDVGNTTSAASAATKASLLSQILLKYEDDAGNTYNFDSYTQAALNGQIVMKPIKGGIRVEYTLGKQVKRKLVPRMIEKTSFEQNIEQYITNPKDLQKLMAYYTLKDANDPTLTERAKKELQVTYPQTKNFAIYVFDPNASERELTQIEGFIKQYTPYTFEMLDADEQKVNYVATDKAPPLFKMALEYYIDPDGLRVRLPANGISFDETTYKLDYIQELPYIGCGSRNETGYTFIPDGSGAIIRFEDIKDTVFTLKNPIYGSDYSFRKLVTQGHTQEWRMPVFGVVRNYTDSVTTTTDVPETTDADGNVVPATTVDTVTKVPRTDGFLAIIEDGDSMAQIATDHGGSQHIYNSVSPYFTPRPQDQYNLDYNTKGINSLITVASRRKYAGNYIIKYIMLSSDQNGNPSNPNGGYEASYVGMAKAYRDYLVADGQLTQMQDDGKDVPLYLETLGDIFTPEYILGFPTVGKTPLTKFSDVNAMIDQLNSDGITNLNFVLKGWINGGMIAFQTAPTNVRIEKPMGGAKGFQDMVDYAKTKGANIFPDVEYVRFWGNEDPFAGFSAKKDLARNMSDTYAIEQFYYYLAQDYVTNWDSYNLITPLSMERIYKSASKQYNKYDVGAISVDSLGRELNSDQNKRQLCNRQEAEGIVTDLFTKIKADNTKVLTSSANAYALSYLNDDINVQFDSSQFNNESASVPFYGMVTHGFMNIAGTPINMSGDTQYDTLKAIENGANPYFIVAYENANRVKESSYGLRTKYYSIDYQNWLPDILSTYKTLNDALKSVRSKLIINHEILAKNIVKVTYEGGTAFILNYNNNEVTIDGYTIPAEQFVKVS